MKPSELIKAGAAIEAIGRQLADTGPQAQRHARDWTAGLATPGTDTRAPKGQISDPTGRRATSTEGTEDLEAELHNRVRDAYHAAHHLAVALTRLAAHPGGITWCPLMAEVGVKTPASCTLTINGQTLTVSPWVARRARKTKRWPTTAEREAHATGRKLQPRQTRTT